jgi:hypothetical protein
MISSGIRIFDKEDGCVSVELKDILGLIENGSAFYWSILYLEATGDLGPNMSIPVFEQEVVQSEKGICLNWSELVTLSDKLFQTMDIVVIGCTDREQIHRYDSDNDMYNSCDIVIQMIDSGYWEIWSQDPNLVQAIERRFKDVMRLPAG